MNNPLRINSPQYSVWIEDGIGVLEFCENVLDIGVDLEAKNRLFETIQRIDQSDDVDALLVVNRPGALSSSECVRFRQQVDANQNKGSSTMAEREVTAIGQALLAVDAVQKLTVAGLQGEIAGPFLGIALAFDFRLASPNVVFRLRDPFPGMPLGGGFGFLLPRAVGLARARELAYLAGDLKAKAAKTEGLVSEVLTGVPQNEEFIKACIRDTRRLANQAGDVHFEKQLFRACSGGDLPAYMEREVQVMRQAWSPIVT